MVKKGIVLDIPDEEYNSVVISYGSQTSCGNKKVNLQSEESKAKNNIKDVKQNENLQESNVVGHLLSYKGNNISTFVDSSSETWWKAVNVTEILGYVNSEQSIRTNVSDCNKSKFGDLINSNPLQYSGLKILKNDKESMYINTSGFFELLDGSRKKEAKEFKYWVNNEVLPTINKTGKYELYEKKKLVINNVEGFTNWYENNDELSLKDKNSVFYIGIVGKMENVNDHDSHSNIQDGEIIMKYGISNVDETKRFLHHKQTIGSYMCVHVTSVFRNKQLEDDFKSFVERKNARRRIHIGSEHYTELFALSDTLNLQDAISYVEKWVDKNEYKSNMDLQLELEREKTKQLQLLKDILNSPNIQYIDTAIAFLKKQNANDALDQDLKLK